MDRRATSSTRSPPKQFNWEITYPGPDGKFGTKDDVTVENDFHVPVNKVVRIDLNSKDVIHSFFVPNMRLKQDAVPGRIIDVWFEATETGTVRDPVRGAVRLRAFGDEGQLDGAVSSGLRQVARRPIRNRPSSEPGNHGTGNRAEVIVRR